MQLIEVDALELQPSQAALEGVSQALGPAVRRPRARPLPVETALGGDEQALRIRVERFGDELLANPRAIRVRRIDQVDGRRATGGLRPTAGGSKTWSRDFGPG